MRVQAPASPVCVVHGPFGTGKSALLVALLHFFAAAGAARCLVSANTNVAVDRVLVGLLDSGFTGAPRPPPRASVPGRCEVGRAQALHKLQQCPVLYTPARHGVCKRAMPKAMHCVVHASQAWRCKQAMQKAHGLRRSSHLHAHRRANLE